MPIVALLTDFGTSDHYVGTMKGVVLSVCPEATLVDLTHEIAPQDVTGGALELSAAYRYFPAGTVFLAVVDPGVGSTRRAIAAEAGGWQFVGPDNGVFSEVFRETPPSLAVELTERRYQRSTMSRTFEGRDRFAPAAGWLARRTPLAALGPPIGDLCRLPRVEPLPTSDGLEGEVLRVDRFGNLITNLDRAALDRLGDPRAQVIVESGPIGLVVQTYAEAPPGALCALVGSTDRLEIAVNGGSAAARLGLGRGARVWLRRRG